MEVARDTPELELNSQETQQIKDIFDLFDTNGGGSIDTEELNAAMFALGFQRYKGSRSKAKVEISSSAVTLENFISIMKGEKSGRCHNEDMWLSFSVLTGYGRRWERSVLPMLKLDLDSESMPVIKLDTLKCACHEFEMRLTEDELTFMMDEADYDDSGSVDIHKFMRIMQRTPWF